MASMFRLAAVAAAALVLSATAFAQGQHGQFAPGFNASLESAPCRMEGLSTSEGMSSSNRWPRKAPP